MGQDLAIVKLADPLYKGIGYLTQVVDFILIGRVPQGLKKSLKYHFIKKSRKYMMIDDELYIKSVDKVLRKVLWREEIYHVLSSYHERVCGSHYAFRITLQKILLKGYVWPSVHRDV